MIFTVVYYNTNEHNDDEIQTLCNKIKSYLEEEDKLLFLPKDFELIKDCSIDQLRQIRLMIDEAIISKKR